MSLRTWIVLLPFRLWAWLVATVAESAFRLRDRARARAGDRGSR